MTVYLDNSATTRPSERVVAVMLEALQGGWYNPSALYKPSMETEKQVNAARDCCLNAVNAKGQRLIFTGSGTEADNIAILGTLRAQKKPGRVLMTAVEHPAVSACREEIERLGCSVETIPVKRDGTVNLPAYEALLAADVRLICVMQVNNESGAIAPLSEMVALRDKLCPNAAFHVDGVQGFLRVPLDFNHLRIQSYALSGHKIHASKGIGALIVRKDHKLNPIVFGGGQEEGYRSGTENVPGILGLGEAVRSYPQHQMMDRKRQLLERVTALIPDARLNGPALDDPLCAPHILNLALPPVRSQTMLFALEGDGIYVSAGSACASHKQRVSPILGAMGIPANLADCSLRFSLCPDTTAEEIDYVAERIAFHYNMLKKYTRR